MFLPGSSLFVFRLPSPKILEGRDLSAMADPSIDRGSFDRYALQLTGFMPI